MVAISRTLFLHKFTQSTLNWRDYYRLHQTITTARRIKNPVLKLYKMDQIVNSDQAQSPLTETLHASITRSMKYKERSATTLEDVHKPGLESITPITKPSDTPSFDVIYIGDSMLERLKTTGENTKLHNLPRSFNLGVGGDKIENVLYRLHTGYISLLQNRPTKLWVVHIGTNNLKPKKPLKGSESGDYSNFKILMQAISTLCPDSKVLVTGLFRRKDVGDEFVQVSNEGLKAVVDSMNQESKEYGPPAADRFYWAEPTGAINTDVLVDHVHLNEEGYRLWDESLYPRILELLGESNSPQQLD
ncbi:hypothetical protein TWF281_010944 [Arthrobotrys megalospora]